MRRTFAATLIAAITLIPLSGRPQYLLLGRAKSMMRKATVFVVVALSMCLLLAAPAYAMPPEIEEGSFSFTVEDLQGEQCGFPIRWEISGTYRDIVFKDETGAAVRIVSRTEEDNLITNLATGATVRDQPKFNQKIELLPDGSWGEITTTGLFANAGQGQDHVKDVGRFIWSPRDGGQRTLLFAAGQHALLEESPTGDFQEWLGAFCHLVDG